MESHEEFPLFCSSVPEVDCFECVSSKRVDEKNGLMSPASAALPSMTGATA